MSNAVSEAIEARDEMMEAPCREASQNLAASGNFSGSSVKKSPGFFARLLKGTDRRSEVIRFGLVGGFCTVLQYGMYVVFLHAVGVQAVVCTIISYAISFVANFLLSSFFTFHSNPNAKKGLAFTASHLINMGMQTGFVAIFKGIVGPTLALLPALGICVPLNYFMVSFAFKNKRFS